MKNRNLTTKSLLIALSAIGFASQSVRAESNASFDARMAATNNYHMRQNQNAQEQLRQQHLNQNRSRLEAGYRQYRASGQGNMSFAQFAHWDLMTAAGTNVQGALNAQRARFAGMQQANATIQAGHASYNAGSAANSARTSAAIGRWTTGAIRGNANYVGPNGNTTQLPYYLAPGQTVNHSGNIYAQDAQGTYYRQDGNYWTRMQAGN